MQRTPGVWSSSAHMLRRKTKLFRWKFPRRDYSLHIKSTVTIVDKNAKIGHRPALFLQKNILKSFCSSKTVSDGLAESEQREVAFIESEPDSAAEFEGGFWAGTEEDLTHLRINLYPNDSDTLLHNLFEAGTVQDILDTISSVPAENLNEKHTSQALVSLWDLQKLMFRIGPSFDPVKDFTNRRAFIETLRAHPVFSERIVNFTVSRAKILEDEPLAASLLCLKRLNFCMRSAPCQTLIEECLQRSNSICLPALSRLAVCMKSESTYGALVMVKFLPFLMNRMKDMTDDLTIRLISIALRNVNRLLSTPMVQLYRNNIRNILSKYNSEPPLKLEVVTLCKMLLCLMDTKATEVETRTTSPRVLIREVGKLLAERSNEMSVIDILSLHRFLEAGPQEPMELIETLFTRISTLIEEDVDTPRLDVITCIVPFVKNLGQRQLLANYVREYLDNYPQFEPVAQVLLRILKVVRLNDTELNDKYWSKVTELLGFELKMSEFNDIRKILRFAADYMSFNQSSNFSYRHQKFESGMKKLLYFYLENYDQLKYPHMLYFTDFTRATAFLIAFSAPSDPIFTEHKFAELSEHRCHVGVLHLVARGVEASLFYHKDAKRTNIKYFNAIMEIASKLEDSVATLLLEDGKGETLLTTNEYVSISKLHLSIRAFGDSPVFHEAVKRWTLRANTESIDSKLGREMATTLLGSNYNSPPVYDMLENFICENKKSVSPEMAEKFACLAYSLGHEVGANDENDQQPSSVFSICNDIFEAHFNKLQPYGILQFALALCFYRTLKASSPLVQNIFSVQFLDLVDEELSSSVGYGTYPLRVRQAFMELNRAVCIDMPDSNVPWFHKNFCEEVLSSTNPYEQYIHKEVNMVLGEVLNDPAFVKREVYSPYYYLLDFLVEFDTKGRPIKNVAPRRSIFSRASDKPVEVGWKAAILVLPNRAFTRNVRQLKGFYKLRRRHLEILGYHVVEIDPRHWNSMYMSEPMAKNDFLEKSIFSRSRVKTSQAEIV